MQTIGAPMVVMYRNLLGKGKSSSPTLADLLITRCAVQQVLWMNVVLLNRGRSSKNQQVFERIPVGIKDAIIAARVKGAIVVIDVYINAPKDSAAHLLFQNLQLGGARAPRKFVMRFNSSKEAEEFLGRLETIVAVDKLDDETILAVRSACFTHLISSQLGPDLDAKELPSALTSAPGPKKKKKKPKQDNCTANQSARRALAAVVESQGTSASQEITFRLDLAPLQTAPFEPKPAQVAAVPQSKKAEEKCAVCKLTQFALEDQGMVFCDKCHCWIHTRCSGLTEAQYQCLSEASSFPCKACASPSAPVSAPAPLPVPPTPTLPSAAPALSELLPSLPQLPKAVVPVPMLVQVQTLKSVAQVQQAPSVSSAATKRKLDETLESQSLSQSQSQSQAFSVPAPREMATPPSAPIRLPVFRTPMGTAQSQRPPVRTQVPAAASKPAPSSASQTERLKSPSKSQPEAVESNQHSEMTNALGAASDAALQREQAEYVGVVRSLMEAMKSSIPMPSPVEQTLRQYVQECLRDPSFPAVKQVWNELEATTIVA